MRESIANSYIFTLVIIFVGIIVVLLISSISYSKTFKIKNRIVDLIETNEGWDDAGYVESQINEVLGRAGYRINSSYNHINSSRISCPSYSNGNSTGVLKNGTDYYRYCVYEMNTNGRGTYYHVVVFMSFDIPIIGDYMVFPLSGDTRLVYDL